MTTAWLSDRMKLRWPIMCMQCVVAVVGLVIVKYGRIPGFRYFGLFLALWGAQANGPQALAYGQNQTAAANKKGIVAAVMISVGAAGGVTGSTIFRSQDAPVRRRNSFLLGYLGYRLLMLLKEYTPGMWTVIALQMGIGIVTFSCSMWLKRQNRLADEGKIHALEGVEGFRYVP
jgi:hypothetical protein